MEIIIHEIQYYCADISFWFITAQETKLYTKHCAMLQNTTEEYVLNKNCWDGRNTNLRGQFNVEKKVNYQRKHQFNKTCITIDVSENANRSTRQITIKALWYLSGSQQRQHRYKKYRFFKNNHCKQCKWILNHLWNIDNSGNKQQYWSGGFELIYQHL